MSSAATIDAGAAAITTKKVNSNGSVGKKRRGVSVGKIIRYVFLIFFLAMVLMPVYVLLITSFKGAGEADPSRTWYLPAEWNTDN